MMAGVLLILMGLARLGQVIRFIPYPVTVGFTSGIALIIALGQFRDAFGLRMETVPAQFFEKVAAYGDAIGTVSPLAVALVVVTILTMRLWPRVTPHVPGPLVALLLTTAAVALFDMPVETIGSRFGQVAASIPPPRLPRVDLETLRALVSPAIAIALLAGIESLLSAVVADGMTGRRHRSNAELIAQGAANLASPLFGGIPATGAIARTATNVRSGGRTPIAGMVHAATLLLILLVAGRWSELIPMATLAGILLVVAYDMSEWRLFIRLFRGPRSDVLVLLATFLLTVLVDLTVAIQVGVVLAALLLMRRMADVTHVRVITDMLEEEEVDGATSEPLPKGVEAYAISGTFFFGAAHKFSSTLGVGERQPRVVILDMSDVLAVDATALRALDEVRARFRRQGTALILSGTHAQPLVAMERFGLIDSIGSHRMTGTVSEAVELARRLAGTERARRGAPAADGP
jgi:SulP family sulfate permease